MIHYQDAYTIKIGHCIMLYYSLCKGWIVWNNLPKSKLYACWYITEISLVRADIAANQTSQYAILEISYSYFFWSVKICTEKFIDHKFLLFGSTTKALFINIAWTV